MERKEGGKATSAKKSEKYWQKHDEQQGKMRRDVKSEQRIVHSRKQQKERRRRREGKIEKVDARELRRGEEKEARTPGASEETHLA